MNDEEFEEWITSSEYLEYKDSLNRIEGLLGDIRGLLIIFVGTFLAIFFFDYFKILVSYFLG